MAMIERVVAVSNGQLNRILMVSDLTNSILSAGGSRRDSGGGSPEGRRRRLSSNNQPSVLCNWDNPNW